MRIPALLLATLVSFAPVAAQCGEEDPDAVGPLVRVTLPDSVLTYLDRHQSSPFVQAFLIAHVATSSTEGDAPRPSLARCAEAFMSTQLSQHGDLTERLGHLGAETLLAALRRAEVDRTQARQGLLGVVEYLRGRINTDAAVIYRDVVDAHDRLSNAKTETDCGKPCGPLRDALAEVRNTANLDSLLTEERGAEEAFQAEAGTLSAARTALAAARDRLDGADAVVPESCPAEASSDDDPHVDLRRAWCAAKRQVDVAVADSGRASEERNRVGDEVANARERLEAPLQRLYQTLALIRPETLPSVRVGIAGAPVADAVDQQVGRPDQEPTPLAYEAAAPPPDLLVGLTDFVIDRARQEAVYSFIQTLYDRMKPTAAAAPPEEAGGTFYQAMFHDTYQMMDALATGTGEARALPIRQAARIPLATWRATLREDFETFPLRLGTEDAMGVVCPRSGADCEAALATIRVALRIGARVLDGDPVLYALADVARRPFSAPAAAASPETRGTHPAGAHVPTAAQSDIAFMLGVVGEVVDAYRIQGQAAPGSASPLLLSPRALHGSARRTGGAFVRVVVARAGARTNSRLTIDPVRFEAAVTETVERVEALATALRSDEPLSAAGAARGALRVVESGIAVGRASGLDGARLDRAEGLWDDANGTVAALAEREYGVALARTARLLAEVRGADAPGQTRAIEMLGLASALADARTQHDVRVAFESAASPIGGWEAKRYGKPDGEPGIGLTLTAYPGAGLGPEALTRDISGGVWDATGDVLGSDAFAVGVSLPIGLHYSLTRGEDARRDWSYGLFLPVIDLGTLLSTRLGGGDVESLPNTSVQQVFAPGLFLTVGAKSVPLTFTLGPQFVPNLRTTNQAMAGDDGTMDGGGTEDTARAEPAVQFRFAVGLDLVLFDF